MMQIGKCRVASCAFEAHMRDKEGCAGALWWHEYICHGHADLAEVTGRCHLDVNHNGPEQGRPGTAYAATFMKKPKAPEINQRVR